jgi:hypothetical protein
MADMHRTQDATVTVLIGPKVEEPTDAKTSSKLRNEFGLMDYIGLSADDHRLLYFKAAADIENSMKISKRLLHK